MANGNEACDSIIRIELITHFHRNPGMEGKPDMVAEAIGRDPSRVEAQLKKLTQLHILKERVRDGETYYRYLPPHAVSSMDPARSLYIEAGGPGTGEYR
jgi:DNA-binding transcriptional ArsR family regulator